MKTTPGLSRRAFLARSAAASAAVAFPTILPRSVFGSTAPGSRITLGMIGFGSMMGGHFKGALGRSDVQVVAVCDCDKKKRENAKAQAEKAYADKADKDTYKGVEAYNEYERLMERDDIDAVFVITPDHWHAAISLAAMRAGKDVYVQKPMTLTIHEGRVMSDTAKQYGSIVQVGSQQRAEWQFRKAAEMVRNGWIGKVHTIYCRLGEFPPVATLPEQPIPEGLDYDRWLGPTPWAPFNAERISGSYGGGWRRFWEYGSRKNGDWGAHHFDIVQWALGMDESGPVEFIPKGYEGNEFQTHIYADGTKVLRDHPTKNNQMIQFIGTDGEVLVSRGGMLETTPAGLRDLPLGPKDTRLYESPGHEEDFFRCIRSRRQPLCHPEVGHRTATICQLSGIAERLGRPIKWDPKKEEIVGDPAASRWTDRPRRAPYNVL